MPITVRLQEPAMWIALNTLPPEGSTIVVDDPAVWLGPLAEFGMTCRILTPLRGEVTLLPQSGEGMNGGCLVRGTLTGKVAVPCNRCAEDTPVEIASRFESFEPVPGMDDDFDDSAEDDEAGFDDEVDEAVIRVENGIALINPAALLWEEFLLSLPVKPLCRQDCKGLCPQCGQNRNSGTCACVEEEGDPRLAALRGLIVDKKSNT